MFGFSVIAFLLLAGLILALGIIAQLQARLTRQDNELAAFDEFSSDWTWEQDAQFRFVSFRGGSYARQHIDLSALVGHTRWDSDYSVIEPGAMAAHRAQCERHESFHDFQYGLRFAGGTVRWFVASGYPVFDGATRFVGYRGLAREDTVRYQAEQALRRSEHQIAAIAAGSPVPMFALDDAGRVILWNRGCELVLGVKAREMLGRRDVWRAFYAEPRPVLASCVMAEDALSAASALYGDRVRRSESIPGALEAEGYFTGMAGKDRWLAFLAAPMRDGQGRIVGAIETLQDITERKLAEAGLEERNATLRALIDNMPSGMSLVNRDLEVVTWNNTFLQLLDLPESLFDHPPATMEALFRYNAQRGEYGPGDTEEIVRNLLGTVARAEAHVVERARPDGTVLEIRGSPMPGGGFVSIYTDITARKAAEASLRLQGAYLSAVLEHLPQGISVFDHRLRLKHWNRRICEILDLPPGVLHLDARFEDIIRVPAMRGEYGPGDPDKQVRDRHALALRFEPHTFERVRSNGKAHLVEGRPMFVDGKIAGFVTTYTDITGRRTNERLLEQQRAELESAQRTAHIGSWRWLVGAPAPECSIEMLRLLKVDVPQPRMGLRRLLARVVRRDRPALVRAIRGLVERGERIDHVCLIGPGRSEAGCVRLIAEAGRDDAGEIVEFAGIAQDITELRKAEDALRASSEMLTTIFEQGPVPLALIQLDSETLLMANKAWRQHFAPDLERMQKCTLNSIGMWVDHDDWERLLALLRGSSDIDEFETSLRRHDGQLLVCEISGRAVEVEGDALLLASFVDVSGERRIRAEIEALNTSLEERVRSRTSELQAANDHLGRAMSKLVQTEKLASLGGLVAGIAHELNTPLGNAVTVVGTMKERIARFREDCVAGPMRRSALATFLDNCAEAAGLLERNVDRAARQVAHFKQVAVDQTSERRRRFDLRSTVEEVVTALSPRLRHSPHRVTIELPDGVELDSFPGPLEQVVTNLVENALNHAFDDAVPGLVRISAGPAAGPTVMIEICDDGRGMTSDVREHAFDPFYTTRLGQGGSGLGLYIVYTLVGGLLGGHVTIDSEPGAGCCFHIELPLIAPASPASQG